MIGLQLQFYGNSLLTFNERIFAMLFLSIDLDGLCNNAMID